MRQAGLGAGGYNVDIDGNLEDEDYYRVRSASPRVFGGERNITVGASKFEHSYIYRRGFDGSGIWGRA